MPNSTVQGIKTPARGSPSIAQCCSFFLRRREASVVLVLPWPACIQPPARESLFLKAIRSAPPPVSILRCTAKGTWVRRSCLNAPCDQLPTALRLCAAISLFALDDQVSTLSGEMHTRRHARRASGCRRCAFRGTIQRNVDVPTAVSIVKSQGRRDDDTEGFWGVAASARPHSPERQLVNRLHHLHLRGRPLLWYFQLGQ